MRYELFSLKTGRRVGELEADGSLHCDDPQAERTLRRVIGHELMTREGDEEAGEVVEESIMCYLGLRSVRPQDDDYLDILVRQLPVLTDYEARPSN